MCAKIMHPKRVNHLKTDIRHFLDNIGMNTRGCIYMYLKIQALKNRLHHLSKLIW
jgi:hypothetical protein